MILRAIYSKKYGHWVLCHDQPCEKGQTSAVARLYDCDGPAIAEHYNALPEERRDRYLQLMKDTFEL